MINSFSKYIFLFSFLTFYPKVSTLLFGQNYVLSNWTVEDGLSSNDVKDLFQDEAGFMWIATEHGLNKFDGYFFEKHRYHPGDSTSIGANFINNICEDDHGNVWVSLGVGILSKYDKLTKKFTNYSFPESNTFIQQIRFIAEIGICAATNKGLFTVDRNSSKLTLLDFKKESAPKSFFRIFAASNQRIYLSTNNGFELFNPASNTISPTYFVRDLDTIIFENLITKLYEDSNGTIWIQTRYGAICKSNDGIHFEKTLSGTGESQTKPTEQLFVFEDTENTKMVFSNSGELLSFNDESESWIPFFYDQEPVAFAFLDHEKKVLICTKNNELLKWNGTDWQFIIYLGDRLKFWEINHVFVDDKNGVWFSSRGKGVWRVYNRKWPITILQSKNSSDPIDFQITTLLIDNQQFMWLGTFNNLYKYYFETEELVPQFSHLKKENPLAGLRVNDIEKNTNGDLWIASSQGIIILEKNEKSYRHLKQATVYGGNIPFGYVRCFQADQSGRMWIGTTQGLFIYEIETDQFYFFEPSEDSEKAIRSNNVQCIAQVGVTDFLIGYIKDGVDRLTFNPSDHSISCKKVAYKNEKMEQFDLMTANTFYQSGDDFWLGTFSKGLLKMDLENLTMSPLSDDFPIIPNVKGIQKGTKGNLWVSSIDGIRSVNPNDQTFYRFSKSSGLLSNQFFLNCAIQDSLGNLYFGSSKGVNKIQPSNWNNQDTLATPILTDFKKFDKSITFEIPLDEVKVVHLNHQDDYVTFEFVSPTYDNPGDVEYAYQLEGFDKNWRNIETQRSATYTNLPPGNYIFKVRAGNKGGFLNSYTKRLQVIVSPPFWQTSWFLLFIFGLVVFTIWLVFKIQSKLRLNRLKIITEIRQKAADDFHDELGHRLTKIGLFVESLMLQKNTFPTKSAHILRKIQDNANELYYSTKDFIWAMNPSKDSALELFILLRDFGDELFADTPIQFSVEGIKEEFKDRILDMDLKRQLVMIFKEAMNNALKHSNCTTVILKIEECKKQIKIVLKDNGKGFILNHEKFGYGIGSMLSRTKKIGGQLDINTQPEKGTEILFTI